MRFVPSAPFDDRLLSEVPEVRTVTRSGSHVIVTGTGELVNVVILTLATAGVTAHDVQLDPSTLEDAFVKLTGPAPARGRNPDIMSTYTLPLPKALSRALPKTAPRAAFGKIIRNEVRLAWRLQAGLIFGVAVPLVLLIIFGEIPSFHQPQPSLGGLVLFPVYVPIIISMAIAILGLISLPASLVSYRDQGSCGFRPRPVPASWVLAAQLIVEFCIAMTSLLIVIIVSIAAFGLDVPEKPRRAAAGDNPVHRRAVRHRAEHRGGRRSGTAARAISAGAFYPLLFFAGMWLPRQAMPGVLHRIGRAARCPPWWEILFRAALLRTTRAPFGARSSPVTYAAFVTGRAWMAS